ncbi:PEP/pyruvate-binding domain-containing protein [Rhodococcus sp. P1Y]|uniref:PEP/pyruvate-binding domain-containing protein n=1 Tax=Rhodococcus sp. P1Y TaxID=1302308 RepID=UPI000EADCB9A|nr:PEP/pyruvate-binding domain-containing protein [Rhodococcus sp. P1Y]AYJ48902.1 pyruvate, phosphate dikinase [Rhodococcus sp. P1Y]
MLTKLSEATWPTSGGKASVLGVLLREGMPVPDGFVVSDGDQSVSSVAAHSFRDVVALELQELGNPIVAVRSSAAGEDSADASAAGQYESIIGVHSVDDVCQAIATCRKSALAARVGDYWRRTGGPSRHALGPSPHTPGMAVLVQPVIEADASGVMFTPQRGGPTRIEASWGLGLAVVGGTVTPDTYEVTSNGTIRCVVGSKQTRIDLDHERGGVATSLVAPDKRTARALDDATITALVDLGGRIATMLDGPQDIEWSVEDGGVWILQARPITAALPASRVHGSADHAEDLNGTPGSHGQVTAVARIVRSPSDFSSVHRGDIVVCPYTDPAWTPLFTIAAGVVTETGGALSHAAIVAREYGIPAVLGVDSATTRIEDGARITLNGTAGTITVL